MVYKGGCAPPQIFYAIYHAIELNVCTLNSDVL